MVWAFVSGLLVAFFGAFFAHLLVSYRSKRDQYEEFTGVLSQIAELDQDDLREAGQASIEARSQDVHPAEVVHQGSNVWRLRQRLHKSTEPLYPDLNSECKGHLDTVDRWFVRLDGGATIPWMLRRYVAGGARNALKEAPDCDFRTFLKSYAGSNRSSRAGTIDCETAQQVEMNDSHQSREKQ